MKISPGMLIRIKPNVYWKGTDIGRKKCRVKNTQSYVIVDLPEFKEEIKLLRTEIDYIITEPEFDEIEDYFDGDIFDSFGFMCDD